MPVRCLGRRLRQTTFSAWAGGAAILLAAIKLCPFIGGERLLLTIRKVIAQDCGALDAAVPAWRDPVSLLDRIERGRGIFRTQMGPTQDVENPGFQVVFGNRPCVMRRLVGAARGQRVARRFAEPDSFFIAVGNSEAAMRRQPQIERLVRRRGVLERGKVLRLVVKWCAERCEHQVVEALLPFKLCFRTAQIAPRITGVRGFYITRRDKLGRVTAIGRDRLADLGKWLAQEIFSLDFDTPAHAEADDRRIAARNQKQLPVIVTRRAMKEFRKIHEGLRTPGRTPALAGDRRSGCAESVAGSGIPVQDFAFKSRVQDLAFETCGGSAPCLASAGSAGRCGPGRRKLRSRTRKSARPSESADRATRPSRQPAVVRLSLQLAAASRGRRDGETARSSQDRPGRADCASARAWSR